MGALRKTGKVLNSDEDALELLIPAPGSDRTLKVTTDGEITISFGPWHVHCSPFPDLDDTYNKAVASAMQMIDEIVTEKVVFEQKTGFASHLRPSELSTVVTPSTIDIYSWLGTYNR